MDNEEKQRGWNAKGGNARPYLNPEIMQAVLDDPDQTSEQIAARLGIGITQIREAKNVLRELPELVPEILSGELSLNRATEIIRHGDRIPCPVCKTKGYVFKKRK